MSAPVDLILTLYRDGQSAQKVAERVGVSHATVKKYVRRAGISRRQPPSPQPRPEAKCRVCGYRTRSAARICRECRLSTRKIDGERIALAGGRWVPNGRGVLVWQPSSEAC